jgi:histidinol-phosphatase (PHP family)
MTVQEFLARGGRFVLSDDSHGLDQVGFGFQGVLAFMEKAGILTLHYLELGDGPAVDERFARTQIRSIHMDELKKMSFWEAS